MDVVFGLVGVTIVLLMVIVMVMLWAIRSGQFEDMEGPAWRVVMDDDRAAANATNESQTGSNPDGNQAHMSADTAEHALGTKNEQIFKEP